MQSSKATRESARMPAVLPYATVAGLFGLTILLAASAPTEATMGDAQRVLYLHVPVAWLGLTGLVVVAVTGFLYLTTRKTAWDYWSQAATELGWLACGLTLATGSLWAHAAWGTAWTWDPRLTTSFVLWLIYGGCLIVRQSIPDGDRRARVCAVLALLGALDVPLVVMATRWFRGMHPVAPEMGTSMRWILLANVGAFTALFAVLLLHRKSQLESGARADCRDEQIGGGMRDATLVNRQLH